MYRDPDFPSFLFDTCGACGNEIDDPEKSGVRAQLEKGNGFTSTRIFCSTTCADAAEVISTLEHLDGDKDDEYDADDEDGYDSEDDDDDNP